jgi:HAD superfamily hydrolase (TIGR01509 family)
LRDIARPKNSMNRDMRPGVLVDVDGTLVDTNYLHALAWSRALVDIGEWAPMNAIHRLVGMGGDKLVPELLGREIPQANERHARRFEELLTDIRPFPGAAELLRRIHHSGIAVVLATSSPAEQLRYLRDLLGADEAIDAQTTADDVKASKPDPEVFRMAMRTAGVDPQRALALGDSKWDIQAARAAGIGCVGVETGGFSQHELSESGALHVYRDVEEVLSQFFTSPLATLIPTLR